MPLLKCRSRGARDPGCGGNADAISRSAIRQLHQVIVAHQPTYRAMNQFGQWFDATLLAGTFKTLPNNPTRRRRPPPTNEAAGSCREPAKIHHWRQDK